MSDAIKRFRSIPDFYVVGRVVLARSDLDALLDIVEAAAQFLIDEDDVPLRTALSKLESPDGR